jgi:hypothetical protein
MTDAAVRPATPDDVPELVAMIRELAEYERALPEVAATEEHLHATLFADAPAVFAHVLEVDGEVAGMAIWFLNYSTWLGAQALTEWIPYRVSGEALERLAHPATGRA